MIKKNRSRKRFVIQVLKILMIFVFLFFLLYVPVNIKVEKNEFVESSKELQNPKRGFYKIYRFLIDDEKGNYEERIQKAYEKDIDTTLSLIEINLQNYRQDKISEDGLKNIEDLFQTLETVEKQLIVRFLYDWSGENEKYEPDHLETITSHMKQLKPILDKFSNNIFIIQGLFTGHWGEMHGTKYSSAENMRRLAEQLDKVVDPSIYLSVRTPSQWRDITGTEDVLEESLENDPLAKRLGLFNDGMLGSESDCGTYRIQELADGKRVERQEELAFQEELCRMVPNGGEVICDNPYNDFDNAVMDMATMHITYLNDEYDKNVLEKWKRAVVKEEGCFKGMDGLSYVKCRLGYRLFIEDASFEHELFASHMTIKIRMKNAGFAPVYKEPEMRLLLYNSEMDEFQLYEMQGNLCELVGGNELEKFLDVKADINVSRLKKGRYEIYFLLVDPDTNSHILLANEQEKKPFGYFIGAIELQNGIEYLSDFVSCLVK